MLAWAFDENVRLIPDWLSLWGVLMSSSEVRMIRVKLPHTLYYRPQASLLSLFY